MNEGSEAHKARQDQMAQDVVRIITNNLNLYVAYRGSLMRVQDLQFAQRMEDPDGWEVMEAQHREVEEALVNLQSTDARQQDAAVATAGYAESLAATRARFDQGLASLVELEDARRNALSAETAQLSLGLERNRAWVSLYRALGGGFEPERLGTDAAASAAPARVIAAGQPACNAVCGG